MTIAESTTSIQVPTLTAVCLASSCATMSVPPVLPPARKARPRPKPDTNPPHSHSSTTLSGESGGMNGASASVKTDSDTMPKIVRLA